MIPVLVLICGDRNWVDRNTIHLWLIKLQNWGYDTVIHGGARGADTIAGEEATKMGFAVTKMDAEWSKYGRSAGPIRNRAMLDMKPDLVVAFHDNIAASKGTMDTLREAKRRSIETILVAEHRLAERG